MDTLSIINDWAPRWAEFMWLRSIDAALVFTTVGVIWLMVRQRASSQFGYFLFLLVLLKLVVPAQISIPGLLSQWFPKNTIDRNMSFEGSFEWPLFGKGVESVPSSTESNPSNAPAITNKANFKFQINIAFVLFSLWSLISIALLIRQLRQEWCVYQLCRKSTYVDPSWFEVDLNALCQAAGIKHTVEWRTADWVKSPMVYGLFRPAVYLPQDMAEQFNTHQIRWILLHELAHIKRHDTFVILIQNYLFIPFFFHPLVWWVNGIIDQQREYACDDAALLWSQAPRKECGEGFLGVAMQVNNLPTFAPATLGMINYKTFIRRRLMRILDKSRTFHSRLSWQSILYLFALTILIMPFSWQTAFAQVGNWINLNSTASPSARILTSMAYDSDRNVVVLYGGILSNDDMADDTWEWDGTSWTQVASIGPSQGRESAIAYDEKNHEMILFGGRNQGQAGQAKTWKWEPENHKWTLISTANPEQVSSHAMAYDSSRGVIVMHGGARGPRYYRNNTWIWDGSTRIWTEASRDLSDDQKGPQIIGHRMVYDSGRDRIVMGGGRAMDENGEVFMTDSLWEWDSTKWIEIPNNSTNWPAAREFYGMAYNPIRKTTILFGGGISTKFTQNSGTFNDIWEWDGEQWFQIHNEPASPERVLTLMIFNPITNQLFTFGGYDKQNEATNETWEFQFAQTSSISNWLMFR